MKIKSILPVVLLLGASFLASASAQTPVFTPSPLTIPEGTSEELIKDAGNKAVNQLLAALLAKTDLPKRFAVLPFERDVDGGYFTMQARNAFTQHAGTHGYELFSPRESSEWDSLLKEIKWGQTFGDAMAKDTVQKLGRIPGIQGAIFGKVSSVTTTPDNRVRVRINMQAYEVETGRQVWGNEVFGEIDLPKDLWKKATQPVGEGWSPLMIAGAALVGFLVLLGIGRAVASASRPR